ncbi:helix-turn-helix transcriptional regulator [Gulosibacter faecalis]|uniref:Helix-turn-helix transcriptional regulator n=1 Tax=Gulosibacter faecalis TaxID=272240 RepID=A0ABW5UYQ0_9MICO|nr:WYL domain-containing protein [Gulosibacter faecalis]
MLKPQHARQNQLLLALMRTTRPLSSNDLFEIVPGYRDDYLRDGRTSALEKRLERDRAELVASGFNIATVPDPEAPEDRARWRFRLENSGQTVGVAELDAAETLLADLASRVWLDADLAENARRGYLKLLPSGEAGAAALPSLPTASVSTHPAFAHLRAALSHGRRVEFDYVNPGKRAPLTRRVDPLRLVLRSGRWLLHAWDLERDDYRTYLLNRISSPVCEIGDVDAAHTPDPNFEANLDELAAKTSVTVRVRPGSEAEARMRARGGEPADENEFVVHDWDSGLLADELAGLAHEATVTTPAETRRAVIDRLELALESHRGIGATGGDEA